ncbi:MAG: PolC-type DNA polymerase III [Clostridia bacterium]
MVYELFPKLTKDKAFENANIIDIAVNKNKTAMNLNIEFNQVVNRKKIKKFENNITKLYDLSRVSISPRYADVNYEYLETVKEYFLQTRPSYGGFLRDSVWKIEDNCVQISSNYDIMTFFTNFSTEVSNLIYTETAKNFKVELSLSLDVEEEKTDVRSETLKTSIQNAEKAFEERSKVEKSVETKPKIPYKPRKNALIMQEGEEIILGKPIDQKVTNITDLIEDAGDFLIKGDVFFVETREIPNRDLFVINFDITDYTSSIRVSRVMKKELFEEISPQIKEGMHLKVQGILNYSTFDKEFLFRPAAIIKSKAKERMDFAQEKRVELHLHTNMSSMDGIANIKDYVKLAKKWGHKAIAVTDHGVVQAFPDAMNAGKANGIKIIYGVEGYIYDDVSPVSAVKNPIDCDFSDEIVIFDLETTGLRNVHEEIIEISAYISKNGTKVSEYHTYVNPKRPISHKITELTGITDDIVENQPTLDKIFSQFLEYIGDRPLVAHNADFDIGFVNAACRRFGIEKTFCTIDTVEMSRILLENLSRHRLNTIAKALNLGNFEHHRADEDTRMLGLIYAKFVGILKETYGISNVLDINSKLQEIKEQKNIKKPTRTNHLIIIAKNYVGLKNLYQIISKSHLETFFSRPTIPKSVLNEFREGLIIGSACESGELFSAILSCKDDEIIEKIARENDFLEVQPIGNNQFLVENGMVPSTAELMKINEQIIKLGEKLEIPVIASGDVHFKEPNDEAFRRILMAGKGFSDADNQAPLYFKTTEDMLDDFDYLSKEKAYEIVVKNTNLIADMCDDIQAVPSETFPPNIEGSAEELEQMSREKMSELYGEEPEQLIIDRLEYELKSIIGNGFDVMYMIAQKLVSKSVENGYLVGSRGSVGSSFVAFLSGITEVNSLPAHYRCPTCKNTEFYPNQGLCGCDMTDKVCPKCNTMYIKDGFDIPFATFLGFDGDKAPDIDLNFSGEYQERAHKHTEEIFGKNHVFRAGTIGTVAEKTAYGFVKKYFQEREIVVNRAEENRLTKGCTGVKRTTGQHPGGLMIVPMENSIFEFCPVQHPADDQNTDTITTHFDYHSIHDNLLKLDLLGHDDPTIIKHLYALTGINPQNVPLGDEQTMRIFTDISALGIEQDKILGKTGSVAVPEFGTKFVREMLNTTQPKSFDELVRISGLSHGTDVWLGNAYDLVVAKTATLKEVICARDDIMNFLIAKGLEPKLSFTIMESVRKGKGLKPEWEEDMKAHEVPNWYIESCKKIKYMFPKAHAVAYVMMAFRIAWFKVHHPIAFYSAYFSIRAKSFDASVMTVGHYKILEKMEQLTDQEKMTNVEKDMYTTLEVCHEFHLRGFKFLPIDIYKSDVNNFIIDGNALLPPFTSMPGLGESAALSIIEEREKGAFISVEDMQIRCSKVSKTVIDMLDQAGALSNIPKTTQISLF